MGTWQGQYFLVCRMDGKSTYFFNSSSLAWLRSNTASIDPCDLALPLSQNSSRKRLTSSFDFEDEQLHPLSFNKTPDFTILYLPSPEGKANYTTPYNLSTIVPSRASDSCVIDNNDLQVDVRRSLDPGFLNRSEL